jgi:hypothetical protein
MNEASDRMKEHLIEVVRRLMSGQYATDDELDRDMAEFADSVPHPRASDLIFYWNSEFDHEPTAEEVVDRALRYRAIQL